LWEALHGEEAADEGEVIDVRSDAAQADEVRVEGDGVAHPIPSREWAGYAPPSTQVGELTPTGVTLVEHGSKLDDLRVVQWDDGPEVPESWSLTEPRPLSQPRRGEPEGLSVGPAAEPSRGHGFHVEPQDGSIDKVRPWDLAAAPVATPEPTPRPSLASLLTTRHRVEPAPRDWATERRPEESQDLSGVVSRETQPGAPAAYRAGAPVPAWEDRSTEGAADVVRTAGRETEPAAAASGRIAVQAGPDDRGPEPRDGSVGAHDRAGDAGTVAATGSPWEPATQMSEQVSRVVRTATADAPSSYDERDRVDLVRSLPSFDDSTPLAREVAEDARRRITLTGRPFPPPPRTRILTVANQKGGVGKTTTTVNLAAAMAQAGLNVLVLDIDPQGNASTALGIDHHSDIPSLYDVVVEGTPLRDVLQPCPDVPNLWCAPATIDLAGAEIELVSLVARETRLKKALAGYLADRAASGEPQIDYVFVDCPPSLSLLTVNAFVAAREVLIPIQCEYYALEGLSQLLKHVELIKGHLNPDLHVSTILLTMYDGRTRLSAQVADEVREHFPDQVVKTSVPRSVRISEAPSHGQTVMTYDPASSGALSYLEAARELAEQVLSWTDLTTTEERV
jgi:chromosome partitioning protein